jgi:raffinose/stachyose/melibiose transport system permease protein
VIQKLSGEKTRLVAVSAAALKWAVLGFFFIVTFVPLLWLFLSSFKTNIEFETKPFSLPEVWQFVNYAKAVKISGLPRLFLNSVIVSGFSTVVNILATSMAAFVLSRETFKLRGTILTVLSAGVLIPIIALMVPYFSIIKKLGMYDSLIGLIVTYAAINIPISVFLLHGFMKTLPKELEEAAVMDGCSFAQRYYKIILPLSRIGIVTAGTFVFLYSWNEFIYAMLLTSSVGARTIQLGIRFFTSQFFTDYTAMYAAIVITIVPSIFVYILFHDKIVRGLTSGAVKG